MSRQHNCAECKYLTRTSPEQVFLLCKFWSAAHCPVPGAAEQMGGKGFVYTHCHVQPEAPACPYFEKRKVVDGATRAAAAGA